MSRLLLDADEARLVLPWSQGERIASIMYGVQLDKACTNACVTFRFVPHRNRRVLSLRLEFSQPLRGTI